eukprot:757153-Hanusia_phi.AAC.13
MEDSSSSREHAEVVASNGDDAENPRKRLKTAEQSDNMWEEEEEEVVVVVVVVEQGENDDEDDDCDNNNDDGNDGGLEKKEKAQAPAGAACLRSREKLLARERDYSHYFAINVGGQEGADQFVYQHFNSLCVIGLAPSHLALRHGRKVVAVDFDVGRSGDKSDVKPSGKKKNGSLYEEEVELRVLVDELGAGLSRRTPVFAMSSAMMAAGSRYELRYRSSPPLMSLSIVNFLLALSPILPSMPPLLLSLIPLKSRQGHLLEMNSNLQTNPDLLNSKVPLLAPCALVTIAAGVV